MSASTPACEDINECLSTPCQNEATCHNEVNAYSCTCMPGYQGTNCESEIPCTTPGSVLHAQCKCLWISCWSDCYIYIVLWLCSYSGGFVVDAVKWDHPGEELYARKLYQYRSVSNAVLICEVDPSWRGIIPVVSSKYSVLTCEVGPSWRGIIPLCSIIKCTAPGMNEFTITSSNTDVVPSTEVTYTCEFGYQLPAGDLGTRICQLGGTWPAISRGVNLPFNSIV
ncbi:Hypothetical predicted protein [Mytilus galloprovincialis]|uniref:Sushi domain-containing protein n=1 Tax=Mytilus galloprovincialis TaxID=29158 RepID=A0A8B6BIZ9_MYTGA|nr:Hypothetical predicted protein [Mytilus galloprovincialis]